MCWITSLRVITKSAGFERPHCPRNLESSNPLSRTERLTRDLVMTQPQLGQATHSAFHQGRSTKQQPRSMKSSVNTPQHLELQANYLQHDLPRGVESVREAESQTCPRASVVDLLVSALCPCVSLAQVASSLGSSYFGTLVGFAALNLVGLFNFLVVYHTIDRGYQIGLQDFGTFLAMELLMFIFGPVPSLFVAILFDHGVDGDISTSLKYIYIINVACDIILALSAQFLVRNKLRRRIGLPRDGCFRVLFSSLCILWFNTATAATSAKKYTPVSSCHLGALDEIPAYEPRACSVANQDLMN